MELFKISNSRRAKPPAGVKSDSGDDMDLHLPLNSTDSEPFLLEESLAAVRISYRETKSGF